MLNIVTALAEEARPVIDFFKLKRSVNLHAFPVYSNAEMRLIVSGIGNINSAVAAGFLAGLDSHKQKSAWLNLGIAGARDVTLGSAVLADKITHGETGKSYYPGMSFEIPFTSMQVFSASQPVEDYEADMVYDMEAAGFYEAAIKFSTVELIHCCKIISDNQNTPLGDFDKKTVTDLIGGQLNFISTICNHLVSISTELIENRDVVNLYDRVVENLHFTKTQSSQLMNLLNRWWALSGDLPAYLEHIDSNTSAREIIARLEQEVDQFPVIYQVGKS